MVPSVEDLLGYSSFQVCLSVTLACKSLHIISVKDSMPFYLTVKCISIY